MQSALLIRWATTADADLHRNGLLDTVRHLAHSLANQHADTIACADAVRALDGSRLYLYLWLHPGTAASPSLCDGVRALVEQAVLPVTTSMEFALLAPRQDEAGASSAERAPYHYAVELDIAPEHAQSMIDWYNTEHLPALAAVPGTVRARRLADLQGHPASYACYDLTTPDTLRSDPWLAVRATEWSGRIRPLFQNVRRTVFERFLTFEPSRHGSR
ncbi:DUF4286 family protein [Hydrogenophaga sp. BPS33]|uniref:DUF4286 family protein n=1 Tax=Hydrogenophaga sp. BPS33 TaxID=2651974 RepID=UPI00132024FB|nr:DUF4286 family protein [Hydrogenophaga sp. BPS33]QHE84326.1 hypothetical protein F9K07_05190 [Hydrogenophaga sp. BPS33]